MRFRMVKPMTVLAVNVKNAWSCSLAATFQGLPPMLIDTAQLRVDARLLALGVLR